jgi:2-oxoglutarate dehydrogenase E2 component (dihydrolipoamide succinyltransferase)
MSIPLLVPPLPESVSDATLLTWHKQPGEFFSQGETLLDLETDKVVLEVPAPVAGVIGELHAEAGDTVTAEQLLALIVPGETEQLNPPEQPLEPAPSVPDEQPLEQPAKHAEPAVAPAARRLIKEMHLDAARITGTGKHGRILKTDVMTYLDQLEAQQTLDDEAMATAAVADTPPADAMTDETRPQQRVPMTRLRRRIAERLLAAQHNAAMLTTFNEVNLQAVVDLRAQYRDLFEQKHEVRLGFMSFFVRAATEALKRFPAVNASIDDEDIIYHGFYDIGIAVSSPRGLVVPVLRNADQLDFAEIEKSVKGFGQRAKEGSLTYQELTGGTFTITNGGVFGSMLSTPILNPPQSAILGMHAIQQRPVAENGQVVIRPMMYLALSYDHRIIDGREAVQFLVTIKESLEQPARLLLQI